MGFKIYIYLFLLFLYRGHCDFLEESTTEYYTDITWVTTEEPTTVTTEEPTTTITTEQPTTLTTDEPTTVTTEQSTTTTDFSTDPTTTTTISPDWCNETCEYRGVPDDCHTYYSCINYTYKRYFYCPAERQLAFNPRIGMCDFIENVPECKDVPEPEPCRCEYRAHQYSCYQYSFCENTCNISTCSLRTCPGALSFNVDFYGDGTKHMQCGTQNNQKCGTRLPNLPPINCEGRPNGSHRHPNNCKTYWQCTNGVASLQTCPATSWDMRPWFKPGVGCVASLTAVEQIEYCMIENE